MKYYRYRQNISFCSLLYIIKGDTTKFHPWCHHPWRASQMPSIKVSNKVKPRIADAKYKDLLKLCREGHIPSNHRDFYENRHHQLLIKGCLPVPDIEDRENYDDDEKKAQILFNNAEDKTLYNKKIFGYNLVIIMILDIPLDVKGCICLCPNRTSNSNNSIMQSYFIVNHKPLLINEV